MKFVEGQAIFGKIRFVDGKMPPYDRPYLIVKVDADYIEVLNVSSIEGKERKLSFESNEKLQNALPPFIKPSFVKLDLLTRIDKGNCENFRVLNNGKTLNKEELDRIKKRLIDFSKNEHFKISGEIWRYNVNIM